MAGEWLDFARFGPGLFPVGKAFSCRESPPNQEQGANKCGHHDHDECQKEGFPESHPRSLSGLIASACGTWHGLYPISIVTGHQVRSEWRRKMTAFRFVLSPARHLYSPAHDEGIGCHPGGWSRHTHVQHVRQSQKQKQAIFRVAGNTDSSAHHAQIRAMRSGG